MKSALVLAPASNLPAALLPSLVPAPLLGLFLTSCQAQFHHHAKGILTAVSKPALAGLEIALLQKWGRGLVFKEFVRLKSSSSVESSGE